MITRLAELNPSSDHHPMTPPFTALEPRQPSPLGLRQSLRSRKELKFWPVNQFSIAMTCGDFTVVDDDLMMDRISIIAPAAARQLMASPGRGPTRDQNGPSNSARHLKQSTLRSVIATPHLFLIGRLRLG